MHTARRTHSFTESVIRGMTRLASEHGAINLAQGFPNFPAPDVLKEAAARAIRDDVNQYAITWGAKRLRDALARKYADWYGMAVNPETEITVTCGATEAMASALLARSEEHTSELQSRVDLVCRLLLEKKKKEKSDHQAEIDRRTYN